MKEYRAKYTVKAKPMKYKQAVNLGFVRTVMNKKFEEDGYLVAYNNYDYFWLSKKEFEERYESVEVK